MARRPWGGAPVSAIRILVVDDHPIVRDGLRGHLDGQPDLQVVGEAASAEEALARLAATPVDVLVADLRMPGRGGLALVREVGARHPQVRVLVLTTFDTEAEIRGALDAGARGYLLKDAGRQAIHDAIREVAAGRTAVAAPVARRLVATSGEPARPVLSARELEVLQLVAEGLTNAGIGRRLFVGEATVKTHLQHIFAKLQAPDRAAAVSIALRRGLLDP